MIQADDCIVEPGTAGLRIRAAGLRGRYKRVGV